MKAVLFWQVGTNWVYSTHASS